MGHLLDRGERLGRRLLLPYVNDAVALADSEYASEHDIDLAMRLGARHPVGPLELLARLGPHECLRQLTELHRTEGHPRLGPAPGLRRRADGAMPANEPTAADRQASSPGAAVVPIDRVGIAGTGTIGSGLATIVAIRGLDVTVWGRSEGSCRRARDAVERAVASAVERGQLDGAAAGAVLERVRVATDLEALADADLVVEAVAEDLRVKEPLAASLGRVLRADAILATATSSLSVTRIGRASGRPDRVVGLHLFHPLPAMHLVEVVRTVETAPSVLAAAVGFVEILGKRSILCSDRPGFIVNRLLFPYLNDAVSLLDSGVASAEEIDAAITGGSGHPLGPLAVVDLVGLDVSLQILRSLHDGVPGMPPPSELLERLVARGDLGRKSGRGFHGYEER